MRMMKNNNNETVMVIGIDHGYGNMKTATRCFPSGVARYDKEPIFQNNLLVYNGMYYQIGEEHKEFCAEKTQDEDYYVLTLAAIARELDGKGMNRAKVHIAAGLPLTWVATQKEDFQKYLLQNESVDFIFRNKQYHVEFAGADIYPQGFAAAFYRLQDFKGINMLVDIGNGTMNIMYIRKNTAGSCDKSNRRLEDSIGRGNRRTEKTEPDVCGYPLSAPGSYDKYQPDCKKTAYRWRNPKRQYVVFPQ